jgi:hypothetical protein
LARFELFEPAVTSDDAIAMTFPFSSAIIRNSVERKKCEAALLLDTYSRYSDRACGGRGDG